MCRLPFVHRIQWDVVYSAGIPQEHIPEFVMFC